MSTKVYDTNTKQNNDSVKALDNNLLPTTLAISESSRPPSYHESRGTRDFVPEPKYRIIALKHHEPGRVTKGNQVLVGKLIQKQDDAILFPADMTYACFLEVLRDRIKRRFGIDYWKEKTIKEFITLNINRPFEKDREITINDDNWEAVKALIDYERDATLVCEFAPVPPGYEWLEKKGLSCVLQ